METDNGIAVGCAQDGVYVRVVGRGTFQNSQPLRRYATAMIERGQTQFVVDVGGCTSMDSTFLGVLAGIGLRLRQKPAGSAAAVTVTHASGRNRELLVTLGLDRLLHIQGDAESPAARPAGLELRLLPESDTSHLTRPLDKGATANLMLQCHEDLVKADERNRRRFSGVIDELDKAATPTDKNSQS